ncbi:ABC transporter substrate-binding protein [Ancylobacter terrae]|uniref:ABC transporter substrate-binding protein n=1 Tax=Ancylobacter sp. sgz301288 TaxID=3342077 RepID=UPI00385D865D
MKRKNLLQSFSQSRREFLQQSAAIAASIAAASTMSSKAWAARENEMNIYCWEGYNSDKVLDPFRKEFKTNVKAQGLISDPDAVNQLRAGETKIWDLINLNNSWGRRQLYPEKLIVPLEEARFKPLWDMVLPEFKWPYYWSMDDSGTKLLGMVQRFGPSGINVNTDKISKATVEDGGYDIFLADDFKGKYAVLMYDDWAIMHTAMAAGMNPFKNLSDDQIATFEKVMRKIINNAAFLSDDMNAIALGMINGSIIGSFPGSVYTVSAARFDGNPNLRCVIPKKGGGDVGMKPGVCWMELTSTVNNPQLSPRAADFLEYCYRPETCKNVSFAEGTYNPVTQMGDKRVMALYSKEELDAIQFDTLEEDMSRCADFDVIPNYPKLHEIFANAVRERKA